MKRWRIYHRLKTQRPDGVGFSEIESIARGYEQARVIIREWEERGWVDVRSPREQPDYLPKSSIILTVQGLDSLSVIGIMKRWLWIRNLKP